MDTDVRLTRQRRVVLDVLRAAQDHPTAAEVVSRARLITPSIGAATVYRTLGMLVRTRLATELALTGQPSRYDANTDRHDHVVCDVCGRAVDVYATLSPDTLGAVAAGAGFTMTGVDLRIRGVCRDCRSLPNPSLAPSTGASAGGYGGPDEPEYQGA